MKDNSKQHHPGKNKFRCTFRRTTRPGYAGTTTNLVLNTQKNPYLNQATQKNTCQIFLPKTILESKILNPKKSFNHPVT